MEVVKTQNVFNKFARVSIKNSIQNQHASPSHAHSALDFSAIWT